LEGVFPLDIPKELLELRTSSGKSQEEFAKIAGVTQRTWSSYESGQTRPKMGVLWALAAKGYTIKGLTTNILEDMIADGKITKEALQKRLKIAWEMAEKASPDTPIDDEWGRRVEEEYQRQTALASGETPVYALADFENTDGEVSLFKFSHGKPAPIQTHDADPNALVMLPVYSQRAAAGPGQPPTQLAEIEAYIPIIFELLGGAHPRNCGIVRVVGDSMTDMTLYNGDLVIFDRSQIEGDGVYVISMAGDVRVKRLEYRSFEQKIIIRSENAKRYPDPEIITLEQAREMLIIHGKVISWVHRHPY